MHEVLQQKKYLVTPNVLWSGLVGWTENVIFMFCVRNWVWTSPPNKVDGWVFISEYSIVPQILNYSFFQTPKLVFWNSHLMFASTSWTTIWIFYFSVLRSSVSAVELFMTFLKDVGDTSSIRMKFCVKTKVCIKNILVLPIVKSELYPRNSSIVDAKWSI